MLKKEEEYSLRKRYPPAWIWVLVGPCQSGEEGVALDWVQSKRVWVGFITI